MRSARNELMTCFPSHCRAAADGDWLIHAEFCLLLRSFDGVPPFHSVFHVVVILWICFFVPDMADWRTRTKAWLMLRADFVQLNPWGYRRMLPIRCLEGCRAWTMLTFYGKNDHLPKWLMAVSGCCLSGRTPGEVGDGDAYVPVHFPSLSVWKQPCKTDAIADEVRTVCYWEIDCLHFLIGTNCSYSCRVLELTTIPFRNERHS